MKTFAGLVTALAMMWLVSVAVALLFIKLSDWGAETPQAEQEKIGRQITVAAVVAVVMFWILY